MPIENIITDQTTDREKDKITTTNPIIKKIHLETYSNKLQIE